MSGKIALQDLSPRPRNTATASCCRKVLIPSGSLLFLGSTVYTCMLNKRGGVESDLTVSRISPGSQASLAPAFEGKTLGNNPMLPMTRIWATR